MKDTHVLSVLSDATRLSTAQLENLMREKKDGVIITSHKELIRIEGVDKVIRRVFVQTPSLPQYATVGWVMNADIDQCMTCLKHFWFFHTRKHCHACGNVNCSHCAENFCLVEELPDQTHGVPVCSHCYWGQDPVSAWHRQGGVDINVKSATSSVKEDILPQKNAISDDGVNISQLKANMKMNNAQAKDGSSTNRGPEKHNTLSSHEDHNTAPLTTHTPFESTNSSAQELAFISSDDEVGTKQAVTPLFVIKTKRMKSGGKVFVNVCTLEGVDLVAAVGAKRGLFMNGHVPVESIDKAGDTCLIFDVFVNTMSSSTTYYDMNRVQEWIEKVGGEIIQLINTECDESLDLVLKFPKTKNNYKGDVIRPFKVKADYKGKRRLSGVPLADGSGFKIPAAKKGWLKKQRRGGIIKNWKERYFVLFGGELRYFEGALDTPPFGEMEKGNMDLTGAELDLKVGGLQFFVKGKQDVEKNMLLEAEDEYSKHEWVQAIQQHIAYLDAEC